MTDRPSDAVVLAWARLERAHRAALATVEARLKAARLPDLAWYDVLLELERADEGLRPFELQKAMLFAQYNLSRLIDRMAAAGYVTRAASEEDGRGQLLRITRQGRAIRRRRKSRIQKIRRMLRLNENLQNDSDRCQPHTRQVGIDKG